MRPPVFKTGSSSSRMTSVSCGSWNRTNGLLVQSQASLPAATVPHRSPLELTSIPCRGSPSSGGRNRTYGLLVQSQASLPTATTPECLRVTCGSRTHLASLEGWNLCRSVKGTMRKATNAARRCPESNSQGALGARLLSRQLPSPVGLPFRSKLRWEDSNLHSSA